MTVSRLKDIPGIGVDQVGDAADATGDPEFLRLENLDTDLRPPEVALAVTRAAVDSDDANSYLPFQGHRPCATRPRHMSGGSPGECTIRPPSVSPRPAG